MLTSMRHNRERTGDFCKRFQLEAPVLCAGALATSAALFIRNLKRRGMEA